MKITTKTILTAIDPCDMSNGEGPALIVGKEYQVQDLAGGHIVIKSEIDERHLFRLHDWQNFFIIKEK